MLTSRLNFNVHLAGIIFLKKDIRESLLLTQQGILRNLYCNYYIMLLNKCFLFIQELWTLKSVRIFMCFLSYWYDLLAISENVKNIDFSYEIWKQNCYNIKKKHYEKIQSLKPDPMIPHNIYEYSLHYTINKLILIVQQWRPLFNCHHLKAS